jgi:SAM-dependent methyltransferase
MAISKFKLIKQCVRQLLGQNPEQEMILQWQEIYGPFDHDDYGQYTVHDLPSESGFYHGEIIRWVQQLSPVPERPLLAGEARPAAAELARVMKLGRVTTAGVLDVDISWEFEEEPPAMGPFDLVISQAILEHLLDPYLHIRALGKVLAPGGFLLVHTVTPGFVYHRYPIDCCRFFPDFFETFALKSGLIVQRKRVHENHIFYLFKRPADV